MISIYMISVRTVYSSVLDKDLEPWKNGITQDDFNRAKSYGTLYQIVDHKLYRQNKCMFEFR